MCTGRIDIAHILRAFSNGVDGVFIGGCRINECNYITHGNYHALNMVFLGKKILSHMGLNPERLRIEFMSSGEGNLFAEVIDDFTEQIRGLGPLGKDEGIDENELKLKLQAYTKLVPYIRLVENEKLRVRFNEVEEYEKFYSSEEFDKLFDELVAKKLQMFLLCQS
jgi:F420-non-reducing hydrogenase iron-sulfur subunit